MGCSLKTLFARKAGAALMAGFTLCGARGATEPGYGLDEQTAIALTRYPVCIKAGQLQSIPPWQAAESYLAGLAGKAELSIDAKDKDISICTDPAMQVYRLGVYEGEKATVFVSYPSQLNGMDVPEHEEGIVLTLRHEWRHRMQDRAGFHDMVLNKNFPPSDRLKLGIANEADARVEEVAFADQMRRSGKPEYVAEMMAYDKDGLMSAYMQVIEDRPEDRAAAMRAAFTAFYEGKDVKGYCEKFAVATMTGKADDLKLAYERGKSLAVSDETLTRLGERAGQKSYMNQEIFKLIRQGCGF